MVDHEAVFTWFTEEIRGCGGESVRSLTVFGSALTDEFRPGASDYNFLVIAEPVEIDLLDRMAGRMGKWRKKRIAPPLLLSPFFLKNALDSYPLEFLAMAAKYRVLLGEDPLHGITFRKEDVRLQCEREMWSKVLLFRRAFLESEGAPRGLQQLVERGYPSLMAIFRGMLFLKDGPWQTMGEPFRTACGSQLGLPPDLLRDLHQVRGRRSAPSREQIHGDVRRLLQELEDLVIQVDRW